MTVLILVTTLACFLHYSTSKRAAITKETKLLFWLNKKNKFTKIAALVIFILSLLLAVYTFGLGAGVLTLLTLIILIWSLIVLITPLKIIGYKLMLVVFLLALFLEQTL